MNKPDLFHPSRPLTNEDVASNNSKTKCLAKAPPSGGEKHSPKDGCGWEAFVVRLDWAKCTFIGL